MKLDADIFDAVEFNDLESIKMYWDTDTDINSQDLRGESLLMLATSYGHIEIVRFLLEKSPDLTLENNNGETAIDIAKRCGYEELVSLLEI